MNNSFRHLGKGMAAASLLVIACPTFAAGNASAPATTAATQEASGAKSGDRLICKRFADTTSRMKSIRACHTKEQCGRLSGASSEALNGAEVQIANAVDQYEDRRYAATNSIRLSAK